MAHRANGNAHREPVRAWPFLDDYAMPRAGGIARIKEHVTRAHTLEAFGAHDGNLGPQPSGAVSVNVKR